jgi:hypothetical protein
LHKENVMSSEYDVKCPHVNCGWSGHLLPISDVESWAVVEPDGAILVFECPVCLNEWRARIRDGEVEALDLDDASLEMEPMVWPPVDIGVGD